MRPPLIIAGRIKRCFCLTSVCLTSACLSRTSGLSRVQEDQNWHRGSPRHMWLGHHFQSQKVKDQGHQAALLTAALTHEAGAAVTVRTYWALVTSAIRCVCSAAREALGRSRGRGEGRGISCRHAHSLFWLLLLLLLLLLFCLPRYEGWPLREQSFDTVFDGSQQTIYLLTAWSTS